jgi:hypothetical protein
MHARIIEQDGVQTVAEVVDFDPAERFTPEVAAMFVPAEPGMVYMARLVDGEWVSPPEPEPAAPAEPAEPPAPPRLLQVSPPTFLLLFTSPERIGIRAARNYSGADAGANMVKAVLDDWFSIIDDPRLQYVDLALPATQQGIDFLVTIGLLTAPRAEEIKLGVAA